jgi:hypothetical protein
MTPIHLEIQYFDGCPNAALLIERLELVKQRLGDRVEIVQTLVNDLETAHEVGFRGSPSFFIEGREYWGDAAPQTPVLSCRYLPEGVPCVDDIIQSVNSVS